MGDVNVALFKFGAGVPDTTSFLPNVAIADHLAGVKKRWEETDPNKHIPEAFSKALAYAQRFPGAVAANSGTTAFDDLFKSLTSTEFVKQTEDGREERVVLHTYEGVAIINLNPATPAAAKSLIPSLERFSDDEIETLLKVTRAAAANQARME